MFGKNERIEILEGKVEEIEEKLDNIAKEIERLNEEKAKKKDRKPKKKKVEYQLDRLLENVVLKKEYYSAQEFAKLVDVAAGTITKMCLEKRIPSFKIGKSWIISRKGLEDYLNDRK